MSFLPLICLSFCFILSTANAKNSVEGFVPGRDYIVLSKRAINNVAAFQKTKGAMRGISASNVAVKDVYSLAHDSRSVSKLQFETEDEMAKMIEDPDVVAVEEDHTARTFQATAIQQPRSNADWGLDRLDGVLDTQFNASFDGSGVVIYIIDTGVKAHDDFDGRVDQGLDLYATASNESDCNGHGTHCASTAGGTTFGVASGAQLVAVRVLGCDGTGPYSNVIAGINWAVEDAERRGKPAVLSLSLGGPRSVVLNAAVEAAAAVPGIVVVSAAGNDATDACVISPASAGGNALTVGSTTRDDTVSWFSNFGPCLDVFAPGSGIKGAGITGPSSTRTLSGTSMAAPLVAGIVAQVWQKRPAFSKEEVTAHVLERLALRGQVVNLQTGSPNRLAQVPWRGEDPVQPPAENEPVLQVNGESVEPFRPALFGVPVASMPAVEAALVLADPADACEPLKAGGEKNLVALAVGGADSGPGAEEGGVAGAIVLIDRGNCMFYDKAKHAQDAGAVGVVVVNTGSDETILMGLSEGQENDITIPVVMVGEGNGRWMAAQVEKAVDGARVVLGVVGQLSTEEPTLVPTTAPTPKKSFPPATPGCSNECPWAGDGFCDDGGPGSKYNYCGLGSDCQDCGARGIDTASPAPSAGATTPPPSAAPSAEDTTPPPSAEPSLPPWQCADANALPKKLRKRICKRTRCRWKAGRCGEKPNPPPVDCAALTSRKRCSTKKARKVCKWKKSTRSCEAVNV